MYCVNYFFVVNVFMEYSEELGEFMEIKGVSSFGIFVLIMGLSKFFMCLDKYFMLFKEFERYMEDYYIDR